MKFLLTSLSKRTSSKLGWYFYAASPQRLFAYHDFCLVGLFFRHDSLVELKLASFQDDTITSASLSWAGGDLG